MPYNYIEVTDNPKKPYKLKGIIVNKYKENMKKSDYKALLSKLIVIEEEFKKNYNQKLFTNYIQNSIYEGIIEGRGR